MLVIGVDPGTQGAICLLESETGRHLFIATPQVKHIRESVDAIKLGLPNGINVDAVAIEDVHSIHNSSAKSNFQFGRNLGLLEATMHGMFRDIEYVQPKAWHKACGITFLYPFGATAEQKKKCRKEQVAEMALQLYPDAKIFGPRGGLKDGKSDALMIAHYLTL